MNKVGLVMAYYENASMLAHHLREWQNYDTDLMSRIKVIIVDDCSPNRPALDVVRTTWGAARPLELSIYRVAVDQPWGQDGARNIGMWQTNCGWNLLTDMDHVLTRAGARRMLEFMDGPGNQRGVYWMPGRIRASGAPYHAHPNSFVFHREDFWAMGGYDEDFVGWYGSDGNFRKCAKGAGLQELPCGQRFKLVMFGANDIADANTRLPRKEGPLWAVHNPKLEAKRRGPPYRAERPLRQAYERVA